MTASLNTLELNLTTDSFYRGSFAGNYVGFLNSDFTPENGRAQIDVVLDGNTIRLPRSGSFKLEDGDVFTNFEVRAVESNQKVTMIVGFGTYNAAEIEAGIVFPSILAIDQVGRTATTTFVNMPMTSTYQEILAADSNRRSVLIQNNNETYGLEVSSNSGATVGLIIYPNGTLAANATNAWYAKKRETNDIINSGDISIYYEVANS